MFEDDPIEFIRTDLEPSTGRYCDDPCRGEREQLPVADPFS